MTQTLDRPAVAESFDLERCFGTGRLAAFTVDRLIGLEAVQLDDTLVVDVAAKPRDGRLLAVLLPGSAEPIVARCVRGQGGRLAVAMPNSVGLWLDEVRVLGVVVGLVRTY